MNTANLIHRLMLAADYQDHLGETLEGALLREAAAALAEARNTQAIHELQHKILKG
jgi:hypothetical protein